MVLPDSRGALEEAPIATASHCSKRLHRTAQLLMIAGGSVCKYQSSINMNIISSPHILSSKGIRTCNRNLHAQSSDDKAR